MDAADRVVFLSTEVDGWELFAANVPGRYRTVWKAMDEVNWDYYPSWSGEPRLLDVSTADDALAALRAAVMAGAPRP